MTFLTYRELAARWRLGRKSIERLVSRGEIQPTRIGRNVRFSLVEIERYERRQSGDVSEVEVEQDRLDQGLAVVGDRLVAADPAADPAPNPTPWTADAAAEYRDLLLGLESLGEPGIDRLTELCHEHAVDDRHFELHAIATRMHTAAKLVADELPERQARLNRLTQNPRVALDTIDPTILESQQVARNAVMAAQDAVRIVAYVEAVFPELFDAAPTTILEPRLGLISPLLNRAAELGLRDELVASLQGETSDGEPEVDTGPAVPWWQNRKLPDKGDTPHPQEERAMTL